MSKHPKTGVAYEVRGDLALTGLDEETVVPLGSDEYGNLRVEHYESDDDSESTAIIWTEGEFRGAIDNGLLVEESEGRL